MSVQEKINRLLWDRRVVTFPSDVEVPPGIEYVFIRDLTLSDRNFYTTVRDLEAQKSLKEGVPSEAELMVAARQSGYWGQFEDDIEAKADEHITFLEADFEAKKKFKSRQNIIKLQIEDAQAKKRAVARKRNELKLNSAEYLAHEIASFQLLRRIVLRPDGTLVFRTDEELVEFKRTHFGWVYHLLHELMSEGMWEVSAIREIARSIEWRMFWTLSRENLPALFNRTVGDITFNQRLLVYWSRVYDSAFETPEPPEKDVVEDDDLFDQWLANRDLARKEDKESTDKKKKSAEQGQVLDGEYVDTCNCGAKAQNKGKYLGEKVLHAVTCPYGTWHRYTPEERQAKAEAIYSRNAKSIRELMSREQDTVLEKGLVQEQDLRTKNTRQRLGMKTNVIPIRKRR